MEWLTVDPSIHRKTHLPWEKYGVPNSLILFVENKQGLLKRLWGKPKRQARAAYNSSPIRGRNYPEIAINAKSTKWKDGVKYAPIILLAREQKHLRSLSQKTLSQKRRGKHQKKEVETRGVKQTPSKSSLSEKNSKTQKITFDIFPNTQGNTFQKQAAENRGVKAYIIKRIPLENINDLQKSNISRRGKPARKRSTLCQENHGVLRHAPNIESPKQLKAKRKLTAAFSDSHRN